MDDSRLQSLRPFEGLTTAERKRLARMLDEFSAPAGFTLVEQGDSGYEFMVIEQGTVDVLYDGERIDTMGPGDFFGELAVLQAGGRRNATIVATSDVRVLTLTANYMRVVCDSMPLVAQRVDAVVAERRHLL
jgi:CRP/FNR family transcriptional regulator, cyclic AMP receptor protein